MELPTRTKQLMQADLDAGNTIITPNKKVRIFSWEDSVYLSYNPNTGEGRYYLGERVMNGGVSGAVCAGDIKKNFFDPRQPDQSSICNAGTNDTVRVSFDVDKSQAGNISFAGFVFNSRANGETKMGNVTSTNLDNWLIEVNKYQQENNTTDCPDFGYPVRDKITFNGGSFEHVAWQFSDGAKFFRVNKYNKVITKKNISQILSSKVNSGVSSPRFSPESATFYTKNNQDRVYFNPQGSGKAVLVSRSLLDNLKSPRNIEYTVLQKLKENQYGSDYCKENPKAGECNTALALLGIPETDISSKIELPVDTNLFDIFQSHQTFSAGTVMRIQIDTKSIFFPSSETTDTPLFAGIAQEYKNNGSFSNTQHPLGYPFGKATVDTNGFIKQPFSKNLTIEFDPRVPNIALTKATPNDTAEFLYGVNQFVFSVGPITGDIADLTVAITGYDPIYAEDTNRLYGLIGLALTTFGNARLVKNVVEKGINSSRAVLRILLKDESGQIVKSISENVIIRGGRIIAESVIKAADISQAVLLKKIDTLKPYLSNANALKQKIIFELNDLIVSGKTILDHTKILAKQTYLDNIIVQRASRGLAKAFDLIPERVQHVIAGTFNIRTGLFEGGLHSWQELLNIAPRAKKFKVRITLADGTLKEFLNPSAEILNRAQKNGQGVRRLEVFNYKIGKYQPKTFFPESWSFEDITKVGRELKEKGKRILILDQSGNIVPNGNLYEVKFMGITIKGGIKNFGETPKTWFPKF